MVALARASAHRVPPAREQVRAARVPLVVAVALLIVTTGVGVFVSHDPAGAVGGAAVILTGGFGTWPVTGMALRRSARSLEVAEGAR